MLDWGPLRALVTDLNFSTHGVSATVTRPAPDNTPIPTAVIWLTPAVDALPAGDHPLQRIERRRVLALRRDEVPTAPTETVIVAPEIPGGATRTWVVDGHELDQVDRFHVVVYESPGA